jgi:hypothetical protein
MCLRAILLERARPDVVGAEEIERLGPLLLLHPVEAGDDLLGASWPV